MPFVHLAMAAVGGLALAFRDTYLYNRLAPSIPKSNLRQESENTFKQQLCYFKDTLFPCFLKFIFVPQPS